MATNTRTQPYLINDLAIRKIQELSEKLKTSRARLVKEVLDKCDTSWKTYLKIKQRETLKTSSISIIFSDYIQVISSFALLSNEVFVSGDESGIIAIWDTAEGRLLRNFQGHAGRISTMILLRNDILVSGTVKASFNFGITKKACV